MEPEPVDPFLLMFVGALAAASLVAWFVIGRRRPFLPREPRELVPWNFAVPLLLVSLVLMLATSNLMRPVVEAPEEPTGVLEMCNAILTGAAMQVVLYGSMLAAATLLSGATQRDLGLPEYADRFARDVKIGVVTWLAALLPVYTVQGILASTVAEESQHPLIKMVEREPSVALMLVAFLSAVIVAPICEEFAFRLLLQGWLEKFEDQTLGWRLARPTPIPEDSPPGESDATTEALAEPPQRGLAGLPYGWAPILASSLIFSLAHLGYGPDPIALFLLALMLGYVYQRTHRIIPCIVTHMLFNLTTLVILALVAMRGAGLE